ncbi:probable serine/threonine-protein kinase DDB_G0282963 isoform X2 [Abrus precatorius]|uniref:Probable serine/threonine-protein kinase DDB_G0282963 isoform X2 n=1 Tax=Abrus precatorius TaxID=3816 RepID=A0A8B8KAH3_ABRPR|nr:probable serine/threonine-protein kinase DDB_G0282963 isoform X2 [Abrus precatorius]
MKKHPYNPMEPRNEEFHPPSQSVLQDLRDGMHINARPPAFNMSENKPVLNYSIQTGEEFALEFMRDRVNLRKPSFPNVVGDPNYSTGYMELKGILGHTGSESGSDISVLAKVEKGPKEFDRRNSSLPQDRSNYGSARSIPRTSSNQDKNRVLHGTASSGSSESSSMKMKVLCSFGGRILPRPSDGKLRYAGGETRIISIRRNIRFQELMQKTSSIYNEAHVIKYQLPGEDLDALVSVSSDEDLRNMMEECHDLQSGRGSLKLRIFLFSMNDLDDTQFGLGSIDGDSEIEYVVAVNGMDMGSRNNSILHGASSSTNNMHEMDGQNIERETNRVLVDSFGVSGSSLTGNVKSSLTIQSSQPMLSTSSNAYETYPSLFYDDQIIHHGETSQYPLQHGLDPSNNSARNLGEIPVSVPTHGLVNQGTMNNGQASSEFQVQISDMPVTMVKRKGDNFVHTGNDPGKVFPLEAPYPIPLQPFEGNLQGNLSEASSTAAILEGNQPALPSKNKVKHQPFEEATSLVSPMNPTQTPKSGEDNFYPPSTDASSHVHVDSESSVIDFSCLEPPPLPNRVYFSERIPREQADLLNRSTKSDDAHGSHLLMSDLLSDLNQKNSVTESSDILHNGNLSNLNTVSSSAAMPLHADGHSIDEEFSQLQKYRQLPDATSQMKRVLTDNKVSRNEDQVLSSESEANRSKSNHNIILVDETKEHLAPHQVPPVELNQNLASKLPDLNLGEVSTRESNNDTQVQAQPFPLVGNMGQDVSQDFPPDVKSRPAQGDILIDIEDRFPRDFLYDMFSKAALSEDSSNSGPLPTDRAGLSLNMDNHEPKRWSYFQKFHEGFDNVSLIDQDNLGFSSAVRKVQVGDSKSQQSAPLPADSVLAGPKESQLNFGEENQKNVPVTTKSEATVILQQHDHSQVKGNDSKNNDATMENIRPQEPEYQDGKNETRNVGVAREFDISTLQFIKNEDLEELKELGSGTFGTVYHGKWRGSDVAIKRIKKSCFAGRSSEQERLTIEFWREADILSKLHHPNVVAFYGVVKDGPGATLATVTEYMVDGSLRQVLLRKDRYLDRRKRLIIATDAAFGMEYLHSKNIVHFDLKCDNLLVNLKDSIRPICKVGDFGLSKIKRNTLVSGGVRGTLPWMAPELLNGSSNKVSEKVDVFSFGIVLWEILTGEEPYANMHYGAIIGAEVL